MKKNILIAALILAAIPSVRCAAAMPQQNDPVVMTVNGKPVTLSEFEYSYNKNNSEGVIDKKTVDEYVDLYLNYKLKVAAALDARYDTLTSFKQEFAQYRDQQVRPAMVSDADMLEEAHNIYDNTVKQIGPEGLIQTAHILLRLDQKATEAEQRAAKVRMDSIYNALKAGADFAELAKKVSQDPGSAAQGGLLPFVQRGQLVKEFEDAAYALKDGEMSGIVQSPYGYHIILMKAHKQLEPFEFHKENILKFMEQRGIRDRLAQQKVDTLVSQSGGKLTAADVMNKKADELSANDPEMKNLIREYYEGLLLYEISNQHVWDKAAKDEAGFSRVLPTTSRSRPMSRASRTASRNWPSTSGQRRCARPSTAIPSSASVWRKASSERVTMPSSTAPSSRRTPWSPS